MVQKTSGICQLTQAPAVNTASQRMLGGKRAQQDLVMTRPRPAPGARVPEDLCSLREEQHGTFGFVVCPGSDGKSRARIQGEISLRLSPVVSSFD